MERLTQKNEFFEYVLPEQNIFGDNQAYEISLCKTEYTCKLHITGEAINRFGELEDVLEKYGIENAEELDRLINQLELSQKENQQLKQSQNQKAIEELNNLKRYCHEWYSWSDVAKRLDEVVDDRIKELKGEKNE